MMEQLTQYFTQFAPTEWFMLSVVFVLVMSLVSFKRQRNIQQQQSVTMEMLQKDLRALANAAVGVGGRVLEIERQQRKQPPVVQLYDQAQQQTKQKAQPEVTSKPIEYYNPSSHPYEQAIRMVQTGATVEDIVNVCGLSKSEADLVAMMHRLDKAS